jgi:hypothetical protein
LAFSEYFDNTESETIDNKIIILKKVKSLRQLRRTEKELVRLCYKEAIIKGFTLKGIQQYIASKTKIWIEWSCLEYLKKAEEQENREWYMRLAKDHFAYVNIFRKAIDEVEECKKQNWIIVMDPKTEHSVRVQALKELHALSKTYTLIVKDLPFVTLLTKYYDRNLLFINNNDSAADAKEKMLDNENQKLDRNLDNDTTKYHHNNKLNDKDDDKINFNGDRSGKTITVVKNNNTPNNSEENTSQYKDIDYEMMGDLARQGRMPDIIKGKGYEEITEEDWDKITTP